MDRLDLAPGGAAPARFVRCVEGLDHDALVAGGQRLRGERGPRLLVGVQQPRYEQPGRGHLRHGPVPLAQRPREQVLPVQVEHVEQLQGQGGDGPRAVDVDP